MYDKTERPKCSDSGLTVVEVQLRLTQVNRIDPKVGVIAFTGFLRMWWTDPRLKFNGTAAGGCFDQIVLKHDQVADMWTPDVYIDNPDETTPTYVPEVMAQIEPDGKVWYSKELRANVKCSFDLGQLPYDEHIAKVVLASYSQDNSKLRLVPRGGTVGEGTSGEGIRSSALKSQTWKFPADPSGIGFITPGTVTVHEGWDYLTLSFPFKRLVRFFQIEVIFPACIFLAVAYMQFFVDAAAAPARATLACIPVLIMRTLSNSVYQILPTSAQQMWLADLLTAFTVMTVLVAVEFGVVQFFLVVEKVRLSRHEGLKKTADVAKKLMQKAKTQNMKLTEVMEKYKSVNISHVPKSTRTVTHEHIHDDTAAQNLASAGTTVQVGQEEEEPQEVVVRSQEAKDDDVYERDLLFLEYAKGVFVRFDADGSQDLKACEIRRCLREFNIYMSTNWTAQVVCMYLRDEGYATPVNEREAKMTFSLFCGLLIDLDKYLIVSKRKTWLGWFQSLRPSQALDVVCAALWPVALALVLIIFTLCLHNY